jgi:hypothetical protein
MAAAMDTLQEGLLADESPSLGGDGLSSFKFQQTLSTKLKILKNTLKIISQAMLQIEYSTTFVNVSKQAQLMIEAYKDNLSNDAILLQKLSVRSSTSSREDIRGYEEGSERDESDEYYTTEDRRSINSRTPKGQHGNETTFSIRTLNMKDLRAVVAMGSN